MRNRAVKGWRFPMVLILGAIVAGMTLMAASAPAGEKQNRRIYRTVIENPSVRDSDGQARLQEVKIGVLAKRGKERCLAKWELTADYLGRQIPGYSFAIAPLTYDEIYPAVENKKVDFILTNPSLYVGIERFYGATRIVTLTNIQVGKARTNYGGVIFHRADRKEIKNLDDLKAKTFMAVDENSFGGWQAVWRELKENGIDPHRDFADLKFGGTHDAVVYAVRDGRVDAGSVRTDTLERMAMEGKIRLEEFRVIHEHGGKICFPLLHSTRVYPEWPLAKAGHASEDLAEKVASALMEMPPDSPAATFARNAGWTIALNYEPVHECLRELKIGPYKDLGKITLTDVIRNYWRWILVFSCLFLVLAVALLVILKLNRKINASHMASEAEVEERKRAEEELRESEEGFRTICESAQDAIIRLDHGGNISLWNNAAQEMFGYSHEEAMGQDIHELVAAESLLEDHRKAFPAFQRTGTGAAVGKTIELPAVRKNGEEFPVELSLSAVKVKGKWHAVGIVRDITERKQVEEKLKKAKEAAEAANQAKSEFLANMSHEIRTPMNGVIGMTELLLDTELTPEQREYAEIVRNSGDALLAVINDILDYSKIEAGQLNMETIDFDLRVTVEDTTDVLAMTAHKKGLELACLINQDVPALMRGDPGRLRQVLINLANNAIKFTKKGEVVIRADLEEEDDTRATVRFSISDTGIGIARDRMDRLFKSFSQVDSSSTRKYGGTGLGLAISKSFAEMMGGKIGVESPSTSLRTGPSTSLRTGPSTSLRTGPSTS
ncbi:MAG: PhnD/SsuA/transferrin family substrate-binding protein, partial [Deltaproteobacteria bacterium]|nr:PhnD/SsuA/transferrin family substrate-binding protein [Deltaproteobacteria bacterium]